MRWTMKLNPVAVLGLIAVLIFASGVVNADTYYVATNGNNSHSGDFTHPWLTWSKAFNTAVAGDTVYFRGGTYPMEVTTGMGIRYDTDNHNGTAGNPVQYFNYQDEVPVLDCSGVTSSIGYKWGIVIVDGSYLHFKGLRITGVLQHEESDICVGLQTEGADHVTFENMKIYDVDGVGVMTIDAVYIALINCDAYNCEDANATSPGRWGSGFGGSNCDVTTGYTYYYGCRAWECSDQGFTSGGQLSKVIYDHCWSFDNGSLEGDGLGWKLGYNAYDETSAEPAVVLKNSIAANNRFAGVSTNDQGHYGQDLDIYNNLFYHSEGYYDGETFIGGYGVFLLNPSTNDAGRVFKNNIEYDNERNYLINTYTHSNNSWDSSVTVTGADFASLELSQLGGARKSDGSLPDITFGHLVAGSDLIDAGTDVGLPYAGSAPDMGAFEIPFSLRIEAETFDDCNVFEYTDAVQIDPTEQYATSMMTGDWATFNDVVIPAAGNYTFTVSNRGGGDPEYVSQEAGVLGQFRIDMDGDVTETSGTIESTCIGPAFSGPLDDNVSAPVFLTAGTYLMTFNMLNSWGLYGVVDWIQIDLAE